MKSFIKFSVICILLFPMLAFAAEKKYLREYSYDASELESRVSARQNAIRILKAELLEEISSFIISENELIRKQKNEDYQSEFQSKIKSISGGSVRSKILDERWDGKKLWLKAELFVDANKVKKDLDQLMLNRGQANSTPVTSVPAVIPQINTTQPVYNEYVQAAKIANVMAMITPVRIRVLEFYNMSGDWPADMSDLGFEAESMTDGENIDTVNVNKDGEIRILLTKAYGSEKYISLKPRSIMGGTNIKWDCTTNLNKKAFTVPGAVSCKSI